MYDATEQLVNDSEVSYSVLGKGDEFILVDNSVEHDQYLIGSAVAKGWTYSGVFGLKDGVPHLVCDPHPESMYTMMHASLVFCRAVADRLRHATKGDSVNWLRQLYALQDTRRCGDA
jgi:hypothetical protein